MSDAADLLVKGGRVVDGTGHAGVHGRRRGRDGRISRIGRLDGERPRSRRRGRPRRRARVHRHPHPLRRAAHFEPTDVAVVVARRDHCVHWVTAGSHSRPSKPADLPVARRHVVPRRGHVDGRARRRASTSRVGRFGAFLDGLDGRIGVNLAGFVGHCAVRRWVMGAAASERVGDDGRDRDHGHAGAPSRCVRERSGFSTSQLDVHADHEGRPVPSNLAVARRADRDLRRPRRVRPRRGRVPPPFRLRGLLARGPRAHARDEHGLGRQADERQPAHAVPRLSRMVTTGRSSSSSRRQRAGHRIHPMFMVNVKGIHFSLDSTFVLDEMPTFRATLTAAPGERAVRLADQAVRARLKAEFADPTGRSLVFGWDEVRVASVADRPHTDAAGRTVADLGAARGVDGLDAMLDLRARRGARDRLRLGTQARSGHPGSDRGDGSAPVDDGGEQRWRRAPAHVLRGRLHDPRDHRSGARRPDARSRGLPAHHAAGDAPRTVGSWCDRARGTSATSSSSTPTGSVSSRSRFDVTSPPAPSRLVFGARGYHASVVNGRVVRRDGEPTGALPGMVLRPGRDRGA